MEENNKNKEIAEFLEDKKKKKKRKKVLAIFIISITIIIGVLLKAPYFNVKEITVSGVDRLNTVIIKEEISSYIGKNTFLVSKNMLKTKLSSNTFIKEVQPKRTSLTTFNIEVKKESGLYYVEKDSNYLILNENLKLIDIVTEIDKSTLIQLVGIEVESYSLGDVLPIDSIYLSITNAFNPYIIKQNEDFKISFINLTDILNIKSKINNVEIMFGNHEDLNEKFQSIYTILMSTDVNIKEGYINVGANAYPIVKIENKTEEKKIEENTD